MHFESGENPRTCQRRSFCGHIPLEESYISILHTDVPGLSSNEPMAIVLTPIDSPSISDGKYLIKNRVADIYWNTGGSNPITTVYFWSNSRLEHENLKDKNLQVNKHNYSGVQRIILFRSGTSHKILTVTSPWHHRLLHPRGLVLKLPGLRCRFRGDWSQRMASFSSEFDSTPFAGEEMQRHLSYCLFSLTTDMSHVSQNTRVPAAQRGMDNTPGVCVHYFLPLVVC